MTKNNVDIDAVLREDYKVKENLEINGRFNKTSRFVLPMINLSLNNKIIAKYLKNAFIDDQSVEHDFVQPVFLLFKVKNQKDKDWQDLYKLITTPGYKESFIMDYYIGQEDDNALVMFVFSVPEKWSNDYSAFKDGRYSKMSSELKNKFQKTVYAVNGEAKEGKEWGIVHKSDIIKDEVVKKFINPSTSTIEEVRRFRKEMDSWDEVWDAPQEAEEIYHYNDNKSKTTKETY